jgi:type I restriction enzyme, R subunit
LNPDEVWEDPDNYGDEFIDYKESLKRYFNEHTELQSVWKLRNNIPLSGDDLHELQEIIYSSEVSDKNKFLEHNDGKNIKCFVRSLIGMDRSAVSKAFADYLNGNNFNSKQIECINIIIDHFEQYGFMDKQVLRRQPFNEYAEGFIGLFGKDNALRLVKVIDEINGEVG